MCVSADITDQVNDIEVLRDALMNGSFGEESISAQTDSTADDEAVDAFISMFGAEGNTPLKAHDWKAYVPGSMTEKKDFYGPVFGIIREETESIYIFDSKPFEDDAWLIGYIDNGSYLSKNMREAFGRKCFDKGVVYGSWQDGKLDLKVRTGVTHGLPFPDKNDTAAAISSLVFSEDGRLDSGAYRDDAYEPVRICPYDAVTRLFSRNSGLLESAAMLDKCAVLVGCGSVGSFVAMELARSGVGKFVLCDTDILEIHNICRHQCGFEDLGRYKVDAVKDKILNINPDAEVVTFRSVIQRIPDEDLLPYLGRNTIIIGGGDNRASADYACRLAVKTDSSFIATACWTRAFAGEIFYWTSGRDLACYSCALGGLVDEDRPESHATYFGSEEDQENLSFEPGIAVDIDFVTIIAVKLALDLLNRDNEQHTPRVIGHLKQYTWVCNTNSTKIGGPRAEMFPSPLWITNNLSVHKDCNCPVCGNK